MPAIFNARINSSLEIRNWTLCAPVHKRNLTRDSNSPNAAPVHTPRLAAQLRPSLKIPCERKPSLFNADTAGVLRALKLVPGAPPVALSDGQAVIDVRA